MAQQCSHEVDELQVEVVTLRARLQQAQDKSTCKDEEVSRLQVALQQAHSVQQLSKRAGTDSQDDYQHLRAQVCQLQDQLTEQDTKYRDIVEALENVRNQQQSSHERVQSGGEAVQEQFARTSELKSAQQCNACDSSHHIAL